QPLLVLPLQPGSGPQHRVRRDRDAVGGGEPLGELLVHGGGGGQHARPHVRDPGHLQEALDGAVLPVPAVQHREDTSTSPNARTPPTGSSATHPRPGSAGSIRAPSPPAVTSGSSRPRMASVAASASRAGTHRPCRVVPIGTTSNSSGATAARTPPDLTKAN